jgi:hypothetical protein
MVTHLNGIFYKGSILKGGLTCPALHEGQFKLYVYNTGGPTYPRIQSSAVGRGLKKKKLGKLKK